MKNCKLKIWTYLERPRRPARGFAVLHAPLGTLSHSARARTWWGNGGGVGGEGREAKQIRGGDRRGEGARHSRLADPAGVARRAVGGGGDAQRHGVPWRGRASAAPAPPRTARAHAGESSLGAGAPRLLLRAPPAMALAIRARLGRVLWLACLLPLAPVRVAADLYELSLTTDGPATTGTEVTVSASLVAKDNGSLALPADTHVCRFHWVHTPLMLTSKVEKDLSSTIRVVSNAPGDFPVSVWVTAANCWMCHQLARSAVTLPITNFLIGKIVVSQNTSLPWPSSYLTKTVLKISFFHHDPSNFFKSASFLYRWDFGDGTLLVTDNSVVYYNYSVIGTFTVKLKVVAEWEETKPDGTSKGIVQRTGDFSASLKLQETLRGIQVLGPTLTQTFQKVTVTLNFLGSPPLTMCWRLKPECLPLEEGECHPVSVASTEYNLTHTFRDPGDYCFSIRAENVISKTHQYHKVQVWPSRLQPAVFAFPCATLITVMLAFIMYMTLRNATQQKEVVENPEPPSGVRCCCQLCCGPFLLESSSEYLEIVRENHGLLPPLYKSVRTYTV